MAYNINEFKQNISDYGYLAGSHFSMFIQSPPSLFNALVNTGKQSVGSQQIAKNLALRIDQVRAPGIFLMTSDINRYGIGPTQKMPFNSQNQEISFSMYVDEYGEIWQYWNSWIRSIFEFSGQSKNGNQLPSYKVDYKENYSAVIQIVMFDHYGNDVQKINLFEAFPTSIREVPLNWADNQLVKLNISMAFTEYQIEGSHVQKQPSQPSMKPTGSQKTSTTISP